MIPATTLEIILTIAEIAFAAWLYSIGYSGAAGLLCGAALSSFMSRRMAHIHTLAYLKRKRENGDV